MVALATWVSNLAQLLAISDHPTWERSSTRWERKEKGKPWLLIPVIIDEPEMLRRVARGKALEGRWREGNPTARRKNDGNRRWSSSSHARLSCPWISAKGLDGSPSRLSLRSFGLANLTIPLYKRYGEALKIMPKNERTLGGLLSSDLSLFFNTLNGAHIRATSSLNEKLISGNSC